MGHSALTVGHFPDHIDTRHCNALVLKKHTLTLLDRTPHPFRKIQTKSATWPMCRQFSKPTTSILLSPISYKRINNIHTCQYQKQFPMESENFSLLQIWPTCTAPLRSMRSPREEVELYSLVAKLS